MILWTRVNTVVCHGTVQQLKQLVGWIGSALVTNELSFRLLITKAKAGNIGWMMQLPKIETGQGYLPKALKEKALTMTAVHAAGLSLLRDRRLVELIPPEAYEAMQKFNAIGRRTEPASHVHHLPRHL